MQTPKPGQERRPRRAAQRRPEPAHDEEEAPARYEDPVDEASAESMIASDPPARSGLRLGPAKRKRGA